MKPLRKNVAIAIDGGGIKGVMVTKALSMLEEHLGKTCSEVFTLAAGTSTGSIISAGIGARMSAAQMHELYRQLGDKIFKKTWRYYLWLLARYKYPNSALIQALQDALGEITMGDFWKSESRIDVVITVRDLAENRTRFIKPWKEEYQDWKVWYAVLASCTVPTYFPVVEGRYVDGGVGSYSNPCYIAAYEAALCLNWDPRETTLLSFGTGRVRSHMQPYQADKLFPWQWLGPLLDTFLSDASDQQVRVVQEFFEELDFRRFQVDTEPIEMDDPSKLDQLTAYGQKLGEMVLSDEMDAYAIRPPKTVGA
ncbi:MAG: patatin-like phospholipase family protein [Anaerolineae bacterium]